MKLLHWFTIAAGAAALLGMVALGGAGVWAQDATPEAVETLPPRPVHIHSGNCNELGEVVAPLTDLTAAQGDTVGQWRRASIGESSYTSVPMTLDAILESNHAINAHLSADAIDTYIACGEIGGPLTPEGALVIGLREVEGSGYAGIAFLAPEAGGATTGVSVFIAPLEQARQRGGEAEEAAITDEAPTEEAELLPAEAEGTPAAAAEGDTLIAAGQIPVSLTEFAIDMPTEVEAGTVTFAVTNDGTIQHSFEIENESLEEELETPLDPGQTGLLTVELAPGTYEIYCPINGHADNGMRTEITVF